MKNIIIKLGLVGIILYMVSGLVSFIDSPESRAASQAEQRLERIRNHKN